MSFDKCVLCLEPGHDSRECPEREGICQLCGQPYRSYVGHLKECKGAEDHD